MTRKHLDLQALREVINPMVDSVVRNPDAFTWLSMMKNRDDYTYNHMLSCSVWAAALGRNLGLPIKDIRALSLGALLFDVGKLNLPEKLITKPDFYTKHEYKLVQRHVEYGVSMVKERQDIEESIVSMIATHHERHDGSGYPQGLADQAIPLFGRIAGLVDCYDALISDRYYNDAMIPQKAVQILYGWSGNKFQGELIEQFIQILGVFPVGSVVELSDGRVGVVVSHKKSSRLRPNIMLILDRNKKFLREFTYLNLAIHETDSEGRPLNVVKSVDPARYGIDPTYFYL